MTKYQHGKKVLGISILFLMPLLSARGLAYNVNQSPEYIRTLSRCASIEEDAVFYNPAGVVRLDEGFHIAINNQVILQDKKITDSTTFGVPTNLFPGLADGYDGKVRIMFYPDIYAVYRKGPVAAFFGFVPIGGGGTLNFDQGLPMIHKLVASLYLPRLNQDFKSIDSVINEFQGDSAHLRTTIGAAYAVNDWLSVAFGGHYIYGMGGIQGSVTIDYTKMDGSRGSDFKEVDLTKSGHGFGIIAGFNLNPIKELNIGYRFEYFPRFILTNHTKIDDTGYYPDGGREIVTEPTMMGLGASYQILPELEYTASVQWMFEGLTDWGGKEDNYKIWYDIGTSFQYSFTPGLKVSAGYLFGKSGMGAAVRDDLNFGLGYHGVGGGATWNALQTLALTLGVTYIYYPQEQNLDGTQKFDQTVLTIGLGAAYKAY